MLTFVQQFSFHALFQWSAKGIAAYEFEVFGYFVHLCSFQIGNNYIDIVAAVIVHSA